MIGIIAALCAALSWGGDSVLARQGLRKLPPALGTFISLCASLTVCLVLITIFGPAHYPPAGILWFAMIGLVNFLFGRQLNYRSTQRLGAARASSLVATSPIFSIIFAAIFTGERLTLPLLGGVVLIVTGIILVLRS